MKSTPLLTLLLAAALVPALAFAAKDDGKPRKKPGSASEPHGELGELFKSYDKNGNHQIDSDELAAMQKTFGEFRKLDKNSNGEIESSEVEPPKSAESDRKTRAMAGLQKVDKNGNHKIDPEEVEGLQKALAGGKIMERLDQNSNGKLEPNELERLNQHLAQGGFSRSGSPGPRPGSKPTPPPAASKPSKESSDAAKPDATKPEETKKAEEKKDEPKDLTKDPFLPTPDKKPPGNFGDKA